MKSSNNFRQGCILSVEELLTESALLQFPWFLYATVLTFMVPFETTFLGTTSRATDHVGPTKLGIVAL